VSNTRPAPDLDAALVLGMASTALPFAGSRAEEAERWLRILRLHGEAGVALQALGVSEAPLEGAGERADAPRPVAGDDRVAEVGSVAAQVAERREAAAVGSEDVLVAVMDVYGEDFERVLQVHGTDRSEVLERLGMRLPEQPDD
jgi:hypothetical protein